VTANPPLVVQRILVPVDGSPESLAAVRLASGMARAFKAHLVLLHVTTIAEFPALIAESEDSAEEERGQLVLGEAMKLAQAEGVTVVAELRRGRAADQILRFATKFRPDLIVMGTRGYKGAKGVLLGSVSQAISRRARTSVVLVRR
jgi:nucleotide-binding universal stress UspA family protein